MKELTQEFRVSTHVIITGHGETKEECLKDIASQLRAAAISNIEDGDWEDDLFNDDCYDDFPEDEEE